MGSYEIIEADIMDWAAEYSGPKFMACLCDPPYELGMMGKTWDQQGVAFDSTTWAALSEQLLPGAWLMAFGSTRGWHRLACAIEDAGFVIQPSVFVEGVGVVDCSPMVLWLHSQAFPKSSRIDVPLDKKAARLDKSVLELKRAIRQRFNASGLTLTQFNEQCGFEASGYLRESSTWADVLPSQEKWEKMKGVLGCDGNLDRQLDEWFAEIEREVVGKAQWTNSAHHFVPGADHTQRVHLDLTAPATPLARAWEGHRYGGQVLKDVACPVVCAQKPWGKNRLDDIVRYGSGALNIGAARVGYDPGDMATRKARTGTQTGRAYGADGSVAPYTSGHVAPVNPSGRWPPNYAVMHHPTCTRVLVPAPCPSCAGDDLSEWREEVREGPRYRAPPTVACYNCNAELDTRDTLGPTYGGLLEQFTVGKGLITPDWSCEVKCPKCGERFELGGDFYNFERLEDGPLVWEVREWCEDCGGSGSVERGATQQVKSNPRWRQGTSVFGIGNIDGQEFGKHYGDANGQEQVPRYRCARHCPDCGGAVCEVCGGTGTVEVGATERVKTDCGKQSAIRDCEMMLGQMANTDERRTVTAADGTEGIPRYLCARCCGTGCGAWWLAETPTPCPECGGAGEWECAVRKLGDDSGERDVSGSAKTGRPATGDNYDHSAMVFTGIGRRQGRLHNDRGSAARYYPNPDFSYETSEALALGPVRKYQAKPSRAERDAGLEGMPLRPKYAKDGQWNAHEIFSGACGDEEWKAKHPAKPMRNNHPCVKSIALTKWLATLLLPPAIYAPRRLLVPFCGTFSEGLGGLLAGWEYVLGIDSKGEYCEIGEARARFWQGWSQRTGETELKQILKAAKRAQKQAAKEAEEDNGQLTLDLPK